jgi:hypothetical protein
MEWCNARGCALNAERAQSHQETPESDDKASYSHRCNLRDQTGKEDRYTGKDETTCEKE